MKVSRLRLIANSSRQLSPGHVGFRGSFGLTVGFLRAKWPCVQTQKSNSWSFTSAFYYFKGKNCCLVPSMCVRGGNAQSVWSPKLSPPPQRLMVCANARGRAHTHTHTDCHGRAWKSLGLRNAPGVFSVFFTLGAVREPLAKPSHAAHRRRQLCASGCFLHNKGL